MTTNAYFITTSMTRLDCESGHNHLWLNFSVFLHLRIIRKTFQGAPNRGPRCRNLLDYTTRINPCPLNISHRIFASSTLLLPAMHRVTLFARLYPLMLWNDMSSFLVIPFFVNTVTCLGRRDADILVRYISISV